MLCTWDINCFSWQVQHAVAVGQKMDSGKYPQLGTPIADAIQGASARRYQNTTLQAPLECAGLFTSPSMTRLGDRIYPSASRSIVSYSIEDIQLEKSKSLLSSQICSRSSVLETEYTTYYRN